MALAAVLFVVLLSLSSCLRPLHALEEDEIRGLEEGEIALERELDGLKSQIFELEKNLAEKEHLLIGKNKIISLLEQELQAVKNAWLPPWVSRHVIQILARVSAMLENSKQMGQQWVKELTSTASVVELLRSKAAVWLKTLKSVSERRSREVWMVVKQKLQEAEQSSIAAAIQPYLSKLKITLRPVAESAAAHYHKGLKYATGWHRQIQRFVRKTMKKNRYLAPYASKEVVWFLASALMLLPLYGICTIAASSFGGSVQSKHRKGMRAKQHKKVHQKGAKISRQQPS